MKTEKFFTHQNEAYFALANILDRLPFITLPLLRLRSRTKTGRCVIGKNTEIVIEGYPRSANTFAVEAFRSSQNRPVQIAHHTHKIAQVIQATQWKIPTLVLIREPEQAVLSRIIRNKNCSVNSALINYIMYYEVVKKLNSSITIASFEEVTNDFGEVISRVNNAFLTNFILFNHESNNVNYVFGLIEEKNRGQSDNRRINELSISRPSDHKERLKEILHAHLDQYSNKWERARALYEEVISTRQH